MAGGHDVCQGVVVNTTEIGKCMCDCVTEAHISVGVHTIIGKAYTLMIFMIMLVYEIVFLFNLCQSVMVIVMSYPVVHHLYIQLCLNLTSLFQGLLRSLPFCGYMFRDMSRENHHGDGHGDHHDCLMGHFMIPEGGVVIIAGIFLGLFVKVTGIDHELKTELMSFNTDIFFLIFTPPILIKATYFSNKTVLMHNIGMIFYYTTFGTLYFTFFLAGALYYLTLMHFSFVECLVIAGILACIDPVPVLECFHEEQINHRLSELIEQEGIFKHASGIIVYSLFLNFTLDITSENLHLVGSIVGLGILKFIVVIGIGALLGFVIGFLGSLFTRFTYKEHMHKFQPLIVYLTCFMGYFITESFLGIGVLGLVGSTFFMSRYLKYNLSRRSRTTISQTMKMTSSIAENIIFIYLGIAIVEYHHEFNWVMIIVCNVGCFVIRFIFCYTTNTAWNVFFTLAGKEEEVIPRRETFVMALSGVRGALTFALAFSLPDSYEHRDLFVTTALSVIIFTQFGVGSIVGGVLHLLGIQKAHLRLADKVDAYKKIQKYMKKILFLIPHPDMKTEARKVLVRDCNRNFKKALSSVTKFHDRVAKDDEIHRHHDHKKQAKEERMKKLGGADSALEVMFCSKKNNDEEQPEESSPVSSLDIPFTEFEDCFQCPDKKLLKCLDRFLKRSPDGLFGDDAVIDVKHAQKAYEKRKFIHQYINLVEKRICELLKYMRYKESVVRLHREELEGCVGKAHFREIPPKWYSSKIKEEKEFLVKVAKGVVSFFVKLFTLGDFVIQTLVNRRGWKKKEIKFSRATIRYKGYCKHDFEDKFRHGDEDLFFLNDTSTLKKNMEREQTFEEEYDVSSLEEMEKEQLEYHFDMNRSTAPNTLHQEVLVENNNENEEEVNIEEIQNNSEQNQELLELEEINIEEKKDQ